MPLSTEDMVALLRTEDLYDQKHKQFLEAAALDPSHAMTWLGEEITTYQHLHNELDQLVTKIRTLADDDALIREELRREHDRRLRTLITERPWAVHTSRQLEGTLATAHATAEAILIRILGDVLFKLTGAQQYRL